MSRISIGDVVRTLGEADAAKIRLLLQRGVKIPPQPRVLQELYKLLQRKELDVRVLAHVINRDPGIAAMLFKVVSSAAYKQHQPFETVEQILHTVGIEQTANLIQSVALSSLGDIRKNPLIYEVFWARSQAVAQFAMLIADDRIAVCNIFPDQAYLAGIFHDCGVLLLMQRFSPYCAEMQLGEPGRWVDIADEDRKFNADHCVVGYLVARHWHLPDFICDAIRYHHDINQLGMHSSRTMVAIIELATEIYYRDQRINNPEWEHIKEQVLPELGLADDSLPEFVDVVLERFQMTQH